MQWDHDLRTISIKFVMQEHLIWEIYSDGSFNWWGQFLYRIHCNNFDPFQFHDFPRWIFGDIKKHHLKTHIWRSTMWYECAANSHQALCFCWQAITKMLYDIDSLIGNLRRLLRLILIFKMFMPDIVVCIVSNSRKFILTVSDNGSLIRCLYSGVEIDNFSSGTLSIKLTHHRP